MEEIKSIREAARTVEDEITGGPGVEAGKEWRVMMAHLESVQGRLRGLRARIDVLVWVADGEEGERELAVWVERIGGLAV